MDIKPLSRSESAFVAEYAIDQSVTKAFERAGFVPHAGNAHEMFKRPQVQHAIDNNLVPIRRQYETTISQLRDIMGKLLAVHESDGRGPDNRPLPISQWSPEFAVCVKTVDFDIEGNVTAYKLHGVTSIMSQLAKNLNLLEESELDAAIPVITLDEKDAMA